LTQSGPIDAAELAQITDFIATRTF